MYSLHIYVMNPSKTSQSPHICASKLHICTPTPQTFIYVPQFQLPSEHNLGTPLLPNSCLRKVLYDHMFQPQTAASIGGPQLVQPVKANCFLTCWSLGTVMSLPAEGSQIQDLQQLWSQFLKVYSILWCLWHNWWPVNACLKWLISIFITMRGTGSIGVPRTWLLGFQLWHVINVAPCHGAMHIK